MHTEAPRLLGVVLLSCASLALADKRPLDLADFHRLQDVSEPAFAPRGDAIIYTVTSSNLDSDAQAGGGANRFSSHTHHSRANGIRNGVVTARRLPSCPTAVLRKTRRSG